MRFFEQVYNSIHLKDNSTPNFAKSDISPDGLEYIDYGATRITFEIQVGEYSGCILKLPRLDVNTSYNKNEVYVWTNAPNKIKNRLCPIYDYDQSGRYLVMGKADLNASHDDVLEIKNELDISKGHDLNTHNIGVQNGKKVIIDYPWLKEYI